MWARTRTFIAVVSAVFVASTALAQEYPSRPIRAIATTSAGGLSDIFMRALAEELQKRLGQPVIVENRPGGANNVGTRACVDAAPDGYTICITQTEPVVYNQFLYKNLGFDPEKGLEPISNLFFMYPPFVCLIDVMDWMEPARSISPSHLCGTDGYRVARPFSRFCVSGPAGRPPLSAR